MKKLTMTRVLTPLAALAFTLGAQATAVSTDGFETETSNVVTNRTGWSFEYGNDGAADASAVQEQLRLMAPGVDFHGGCPFFAAVPAPALHGVGDAPGSRTVLFTGEADRLHGDADGAQLEGHLGVGHVCCEYP